MTQLRATFQTKFRFHHGDEIRSGLGEMINQSMRTRTVNPSSVETGLELSL